MATPPIIDVVRLEGILEEFGDAALEEFEDQGMLRLMNVLEAKSVELTPVQTGNLESSSVVRVNKSGSRIIGTLTFGAPYAATVHELPPERRGPRTREKAGNEFGPAGSKYVERPLRGFQVRLTRDAGEFLQSIWRRASRG